MKTIPTAEEIYQEITKRPIFDMYNPNIKKAMIEFAKLHVEAALKAASEKVSVVHKNYKGSYQIEFPYSVDDYSDLHLDKDSILNSYPLDKIK